MEAYTDEERGIIDAAKRDGTWMKAPDGEPTKLTERQWVQARTRAFKDWFGDWEKAARVEKLRKSKPVEITGDEIEPSDDLKQYKKNALEYGKKLQGEYVNKDTGRTIQLQRGRRNGGIKEVLQHDTLHDTAQIKSVAAIPEIIGNAIYIDSAENRDSKKNPNVVAYHYYVCGLKIGSEDYTVRMVEAEEKDGSRYYDHKLTHMEKGKLMDELALINHSSSTELSSTPGTGAEERNRPTNRGEIQAAPISKGKDKVLSSILQANVRKDVDVDGEPKAKDVEEFSHGGADDLLFREVDVDGDKTLVGVHNISEEKFRKAMRLGGFANPSAAVIDLGRQSHEGYGEISLLLPSSMIDKRTGRNAGTFENDAWTPVYPTVERQFSGEGDKRAAKDIQSVPEGMRNVTRNGINSWMDGRSGRELAYLFLHERGEAPELVMNKNQYDDATRKAVADATQGSFSLSVTDEVERQKVLDVYINVNFGGDKEAYQRGLEAKKEKLRGLLGHERHLVRKMAQQDLSLIEETGFDYDAVSKFVRSVEDDIRHGGKVNDGGTLLKAQEAIEKGGLQKDFARWLDGLDDRYETKEVIFDGFTPSGNRRYLPNTLEKVSAFMKKQGRGGATGMSSGFSNFAASLLKAKGTLKDIRKGKKKLTANHDDVEEFRDKWGDVFYALGMKLQPGAKDFEDYGMARLSEAAKQKNPQKYLKDEYGIDFSDEDTRKLKEMVDAIREEYPAMYFETKFERPVYLNEFAAAVVPDNVSEDVAKALEDAGLTVTRYKHGDSQSRREAMERAANEDVRFRSAGGRMTGNDIEEANRRFNEELQQQVDGKLPEGHIYQLGRPGDILLSAGFPNMPIELSSTRLSEKFRQSNHPFGIEAVKNLVKHLNAPIAVFKYGNNAKNVIIGVEYNGKQFLVGVHFNQSHRGTEISDIRGIFPKDNAEWLNWITQGKADYLDKERIQDLLDKQRINLAEVGYLDLDSTSKIVENFENPNFPGENLRDGGRLWTDGDLSEGKSSGEADEANERFNEELEGLREENADSVVLSLGRPSAILRAAGVEDKPMKLYGNKVIKKMKKHGFKLEELRDLPEAVANPIAVFNNYQRNGNRSILTELRTSNGNFLVTVDLGKDADVDFNIVTSVFGKGDNNVIDWINKGYATYIDKKKTLDYLHFSGRSILEASSRREVKAQEFLSHQSAPIAATAANPELSSSANIVRNFENPSVSEENLRGGNGVLTDDDLAGANDPVSKLVGKSTRTAAQRKEFAERERERMAGRVQKLAEKLHLDNVGIVTDASTLNGRRAKAKGFYSRSTGRITIVIPNHSNLFDVEQTLLHEAVAHYGLRQLFGKHFDTFLRNVYENADVEVRQRITELASHNGWDYPTATEEYLASLAENTNFEDINASWWSKIKDLFLKMLHKIGFKDFSGVTLSDNELRYILWRSYENLAEPGRYRSILGEAADVAKQAELKVGNYIDKKKALDYLHHSALLAEALSRPRLSRATKIVENFENPGVAEENVAEPAGEKMTGGLEEVNKRFNEDLGKLTEENSQSVILKLGNPGRILLSAGLSNKPIRLYGNKVMKKIRKHGFSLYDIKNLPVAINHPIAVFNNYGSGINRAVLTELKTSQGNVLVTIEWGKGTDAELNIVTSVFGKGKNNVIDWINNGYATYIDKEKALSYLRIPAPIAGAQDNQELSRAAKIVEKFENPAIGDEKDGDDVLLFRGGEDGDAVRTATEIYEEGVANTLAHRLDEAWYDYLRSVRVLQESLSKALGRKIDDYEDVYLHALHKSSVDNREWLQMMKKYVRPLNDALHKITHGKDVRFRGRAVTLDDIEVYLNSKHGLERNEDFAMRDAEETAAKGIKKAEEALAKEEKEAGRMRDRTVSRLEKRLSKGEIDVGSYGKAVSEAQAEYVREMAEARAACEKTVDAIRKKIPEYYAKNRERDYSGLTALFDPEGKGLGVRELERAAAAYAREFEESVGWPLVGELWDKVREMNRYSLRKSYESGLIGKDSYERTLNRFTYYVPLRGFDGETAADVYDYITEGEMPVTKVLKHAKGRKSRAKDLIATMMNMGHSAIVSGNRNMVKQRLLNLALNADNALLSVSDQWYERVGEDEWVPAREPSLSEGMSAEEVRKAIEDYESEMKAKEERGEAKRMKKGVKLNVRIDSKRKEYEHGVRVKRGGRDYVVWVNGNPKAAQAVNGLLNPETKHSFVTDALRTANRFISKNVTAFNPKFLMRNLKRDILSANLVGFAKYGLAYTMRFDKYVKDNLSLVDVKGARAGRFSGIYDLYVRYEKGTLDMNVKRDRRFKEFIENGGETGYSQLWSIEDYQQAILKSMDRGSVSESARNGIAAIGAGVEFMNRGIENVCRFAAYMASRDMGLTVLESVRDAKEASVNFNRKGSGALGNDFARAVFMFMNPSIQGMVQLVQLTRRYPKRMLPVLGGVMGLGVLSVLVAASVGGGDDDDDYYNLNPFVRRSNLIVRIGAHEYLRWDLPPDLRPWYGLGEIACSALLGKMEYESVPLAVLSQLSQILPLDPVNETAILRGDESNLKGVVKNVARATGLGSWLDAYIFDEDFTGRKISGATDYNKLDPEWKRAGFNTSELMIGTSRTLNRWSGGNDSSRGWVDFNPSRMEHFLKGVMGGWTDFPVSVVRGCEAFFSDDDDVRLDTRNYPVLGDSYIRTDNRRMRNVQVNTAYQWYKHEYELTGHKLKSIAADKGKDVFRRAEEAGELAQSPEGQRYRTFSDYKRYMDELYGLLDETEDEGKRKELERELDRMRKELVEKLERTQGEE